MIVSTSYQNAAAPATAPAEMSLVARLARFFRSHERQWVDGKSLASIAGGYAWRTRCSDLRRAPFFMAIENRQRRVETAPGKFITVSEYRYVADQPEAGA